MHNTYTCTRDIYKYIDPRIRATIRFEHRLYRDIESYYITNKTAISRTRYEFPDCPMLEISFYQRSRDFRDLTKCQPPLVL